MLQKIYNSSGQKAYQRDTKEDRAVQYMDWIRKITNPKGYFMDVDLVKFNQKDGKIYPVAITEVTRCDSEDPVGRTYLAAIVQRYFKRDIQGRTIQTLADMLHVPAYLVLFAKNMTWLRVYSFQQEAWQPFTPEEWAEFLRGL